MNWWQAYRMTDGLRTVCIFLLLPNNFMKLFDFASTVGASLFKERTWACQYLHRSRIHASVWSHLLWTSLFFWFTHFHSRLASYSWISGCLFLVACSPVSPGLKVSTCLETITKIWKGDWEVVWRIKVALNPTPRLNTLLPHVTRLPHTQSAAMYSISSPLSYLKMLPDQRKETDEKKQKQQQEQEFDTRIWENR